VKSYSRNVAEGACQFIQTRKAQQNLLSVAFCKRGSPHPPRLMHCETIDGPRGNVVTQPQSPRGIGDCPCRKCYPSRMPLKSATTSTTRANPATGCSNVTCPCGCRNNNSPAKAADFQWYMGTGLPSICRMASWAGAVRRTRWEISSSVGSASLAVRADVAKSIDGAVEGVVRARIGFQAFDQCRDHSAAAGTDRSEGVRCAGAHVRNGIAESAYEFGNGARGFWADGLSANAAWQRTRGAEPASSVASSGTDRTASGPICASAFAAAPRVSGSPSESAAIKGSTAGAALAPKLPMARSRSGRSLLTADLRAST